jgi:hypothetical protein
MYRYRSSTGRKSPAICGKFRIDTVYNDGNRKYLQKLNKTRRETTAKEKCKGRSEKRKDKGTSENRNTKGLAKTETQRN